MFPTDSQTVVLATSFTLLGLACIQSTLEMWSARQEYAFGGLLHWRPYQSTALHPTWERMFATVFSTTGISLLLILRLCSGIVLAGCSFTSFFSLCIPAVACVAGVSLLLRLGCPIGVLGADGMSFVIAVGLLDAAVFRNTAWGSAGLWFVAAQSCLSYFAAGFGKFFGASWRNGEALPAVFQSSIYGHPVIAKLVSRRWIALTGGWMVVLFEASFPVVLILPTRAALLLLSIAVIFHLFNLVYMGLGSFFWTFPAAYPAIWYCNGVLRQWFATRHHS